MSEEITQAPPVVSEPTTTIPTPAPRKVIIAFDESKIGYHVLDWVNTHSVLLPTDQVTIVLVIEEGSKKVVVEQDKDVEPIKKEHHEVRESLRTLEDKAKDRLKTPCKSIQHYGIKNVKGEVLVGGNAGEAISKYAKSEHADVVICGNRGFGFLKRKLMGSTSEYLTHHITCTLMVVRLEEEEEKDSKSAKSPRLSPKSPRLSPKSPKLAPKSPQLGPKSPKLSPNILV